MAPISNLVLAVMAWAPIALAYEITIDRRMVENFHDDLTVCKLSGLMPLPDSLMQQLVNSIAPGAQFTGNSGPAAAKGEQTVAWVNPITGATAIFPQYEQLIPSDNINTGASNSLFTNKALFPSDDTMVMPALGPKLLSVTHLTDGTNSNSTDPLPVLSYVFAQRMVAANAKTSLSVRGPGSTAVFGFGAGGNLKSFSYDWRQCISTTTVKPAPVKDIVDAILAQLKSAATIAPYTVTSIEPWYYDDGTEFIQPVFYFTASRDKNKTLPAGAPYVPAKLAGYVPMGAKAFSPLPDLNKPEDTTSAATPPPEGKPPRAKREEKEGFFASSLGISKRGVVPTVKVGRYVVRADEAGWTISANNFWTNLSKWSGKFANFVNTQYYYAQPYLFLTSKQSYLNAVHLALTEVHGNWGLFTTYQNWQDYVYVSQIGAAGGYGAGAGGLLAYWIIHACEVIPTETDYPAAPKTSYNIWWNVFNGLHAVLGYRTEMYIDDGVTTPFANSIGANTPVVNAWLQAVHNDFAWYGSSSRYPQTYYDNNRKMNQPFGRSSAIYVCGHVNDVVSNVAPLPKANCLSQLYYAN